MNGMRAPVVAGVGGGVGTTTVAVGLRGHDRGVTGRRSDGLPDILVCRGTLDSVRRAAAVLDEAGTEPPPVLAVTLAGRAPRARCGRAWSCSKRTPQRWCCCRTSRGGARSRTRWPRRRNCSWNRPRSCPGRCAPTPRRCANWWPRWRHRAASPAIRSGSPPVPRIPGTPTSGPLVASVRTSGPFVRNAAGRRSSARSAPSGPDAAGRGAGRADSDAIPRTGPGTAPRAGRRRTRDEPAGDGRPATSRHRSSAAPTGRADRGARAVRPTGPQRPREDRAGAPAERVEQVG